MALKYWLSENPLTRNRNERVAVTQSLGAYTIEDVIDRMIRAGSSITKAEALATIEEFNQAVLEVLERGYTVNTPLFSIAPSITGVFKNDDDRFDVRRHKVKARFRAGSLLRDMAKNIKVKKVDTTARKPLISSFYDSYSRTANRLLTPGGAATICGKLLKVNEKEEQQGIFFIHNNSGKATRVTEKLLRNKHGELIFLIPHELVAGAYTVEVRAVIRDVKAIRAGSLRYMLQVE